MHFLDSYMEYVEPVGGSMLWHKWSAISVVSAALERRVWQVDGNKQIFPNMYIIINGLRGGGKGYATDMAVDFLHSLNARYKQQRLPGICFTSDKLTPASLIREMQRAKKEIKLPNTGNLYTYHALFSYAEELSSFIADIGGGSITSDILKFYNCDREFTKDIIKENDIITIPNVSFSCLWATQPSFLERHLPKEASREGLLSRIILISDLTFYRFKRLHSSPNVGLEMHILNQLDRISKMVGQMKESPEAAQVLDDWNERWNDQRASMPDMGVYTEYLVRKKLHVTKLCMILAACRNSLTIEEEDALRALELLAEAEGGMKAAFGVKDISKDSDAIMQFFSYIPKTGIFEDELIRAMIKTGKLFPRGMNLTNAINTLLAAKLIEVSQKNDRVFITRLRDPDDNKGS